MDNIRKDVEELVEKELRSANEKFPLFASDHEGYAVIKEEVMEAKYDNDVMNDLMEKIQDNVFLDDSQFTTYYNVKKLKKAAINAAIESIQVAAMCDKFTKYKRPEREPACEVLDIATECIDDE